jgi:hypothetical protein
LLFVWSRTAAASIFILGDQGGVRKIALLSAGNTPSQNSVRKSLGFSRCSTNLQRSFPIKSLSHFFSSLEEGNGFLSDRDDNSSAGIAASPRSPEPSRKRSKPPQLHSISVR